MALYVAVNTNMYLAEMGVAMAIVPILPLGTLRTYSDLFATDNVERI